MFVTVCFWCGQSVVLFVGGRGVDEYYFVNWFVVVYVNYVCGYVYFVEGSGISV